MARTPVLLILAISVSVTSACAKKPQPTAIQPTPPVVEPPPPPPPPPPPEPAPPPPATAPTDDEIFARKSLAALNAERPLGTVFFAYDRADLDDEARATLAANAEWMRRWTSTRITVEGHCDERGTAEYNIALGDRRAAAVRGYLVSLGIAGDRVTAVSKGKEAPVCGESTESCWRQNRRGAPIITAK
jgi:peptidoglycan-associated lipoprotein